MYLSQIREVLNNTIRIHPKSIILAVMDPLQTPIEYLKGVGPNRANLLKQELSIYTYHDLLHFFPTAILIVLPFLK